MHLEQVFPNWSKLLYKDENSDWRNQNYFSILTMKFLGLVCLLVIQVGLAQRTDQTKKKPAETPNKRFFAGVGPGFNNPGYGQVGGHFGGQIGGQHGIRPQYPQYPSSVFPGQFPGSIGVQPGYPQNTGYPGQFPGQFPGHFPGVIGAHTPQGIVSNQQQAIIAGIKQNNQVAAQLGCTRWCKIPNTNQHTCCDAKPGYCPPLRPLCPPVRNHSPPQTCYFDSQCQRDNDKCCPDICLPNKVCKERQ